MKAAQAILFFVCVVLSACGRDRHIELDSAVRSTSQGEYTLIVFTDQFVSFQKDGSHKYQYYFISPLSDTDIDRIKSAVEQSRAKKHAVQVIDGTKDTKLRRFFPDS